MLPWSVPRWFGAGKSLAAYRVEPFSNERGPEAHLDPVKLTMPPGTWRITDKIKPNNGQD
jgi:hypothetical protein